MTSRAAGNDLPAIVFNYLNKQDVDMQPCWRQVTEQERASKEAASEAELRRSIEASLAEKVKQEKLSLSRRALEMGKQKVCCYIPCRYCYLLPDLLCVSPCTSTVVAHE